MKSRVPAVGETHYLVCQGRKKLNCRNLERRVLLLVPVKDAFRTFGLLGALNHIDITWWRVQWFWIGVDILEDHRPLEKTGTGGALVRTVYAKRPLDILGRKGSLKAHLVPTLFGACLHPLKILQTHAVL